MSFDLQRDVCMVGLGASAPLYYRVMMPAIQLGVDWCGIASLPPKLQVVTGSIRKTTQPPDLIGDYKVVVLQQPKGEAWEQTIEAMQEAGKKVIFEVDDYLHGVEERGGEDTGRIHGFDKRALILYERCMRMCDAMIVSTDYLAKKYAKFNPNIYVCRNGIDPLRYQLTRPKRDTVNIGWAGASGHLKALAPWINVVNAIMLQREDTCFVSVGQNYADAIKPNVGEARAIAIPFTALEQYPAAMTMFDIALAPGGGGTWYRGKSDLRWLEASALGIPIIARPSIYREIEDRVTGFHATGPHEMAPVLMELLNDADLRKKVGQAAKEYVLSNRTVKQMAQEWADAFRSIAG
jgi:glycosyltransferase involved in cell wall biosynthesis